MDARTAKSIARKAGLDLYYDTQWTSWGLIAPGHDVQSEWFSPGSMRDMTRPQLDTLIGLVADRVAARAKELEV
jgi:hypothetical protein